MTKVGDVVLYAAFGRTVNAIVLKVGPTQPSHAGVNGEDTLTLAFVDQGRESNPRPNLGPLAERPGYLPAVITEHDVVHASHEFSAEYKREKGLSTPAQIAAERGHGTWVEAFTCSQEQENSYRESIDRRIDELKSQIPQESTDVPTSD